ncbi:MAG: tetratricopeptide repeat protein [Thermoplasmata archaeon]|nr:MAG: tetratricopeptide repeat protein [Thermoplasmata archaeon]
MAAAPRLTVSEKILLHLLERVRFEDRFEVPYSLTQGGIADAVHVRRSYVSSSTKEMIKKGLAEERLSHVTGEARRRKTYLLTPEGKKKAERLRDEIAALRVIFRNEQGEREAALGDIRKEMKSTLPLIDMLEAVSEEGILDFDAKGPGEQEAKMDYPQRQPSPRYFFGREKELGMFSQWLSSKEGRILAVRGIAGIGKTTFISKVGEKERENRRVFWYRFHDWSSQRNLLSALGDFLAGARREGLRLYLDENKLIDVGDVQALLAGQLKGVKALLVFDDFHRIDEAVLPLFEAALEILDKHPGVKVVLAGRSIPRFFDIRDVVVRKTVWELKLDGLDLASSRKLLKARNIDERNFDEIYESTKGHPLSLELAEITDRGVGKGNIEQYLSEEVLAKLTEKQKCLLRFVSVFRYPVPSDAYLSIPQKKGEEVTFETLDELVERALITPSDSLFDVHDIIRDFFYSRLGPDTKAAYHQKVAEYFEDEAGDLAAVEAMFHHIKAGNQEKAGTLALQHGEHLINRGYLDEFLEVLSAVERDVMPPERQAKLLVMEGDCATTMGQWDRAYTLYNQCLEAACRAEDSMQEAQAYYKMAAIHLRRGALGEALSLSNRSLELLKDGKEPAELAKLYNNIGVIFWKKGSLDQAIENYETSLKIAEDIGDLRGVARAQNNLGIIHWEKGNVEEAMDFYTRSLDISEQLADRKTMAQLYDNLGEAFRVKGEPDRALEFYKKSLELSEKLGFRWQIAEVFRNMGRLYEGEERRGYLLKAYEMFNALGAKKDAEELKASLEEP